MEENGKSSQKLSPWWRRSVIIVLVIGFSVLIWMSIRVYEDAPPIPENILGPSGETIFTRKDIVTGQQTNDVFTGYLDLGSPSQLTPTQVEILRKQSSWDPQTVETIQIGEGKPFVRTFLLRQNDVYFAKLLPQKP